MDSYAGSLFLSNKRMMATSDRHLVLDDIDGEGDLPCPYCYEELFDVQSLCDHIEDEHCYETQSAACPMCHMHVRDMVGHLTTHHTQLLFKNERGRVRPQAGAGGRRAPTLAMHSKGATSRMLDMDLGCCEGDYLEQRVGSVGGDGGRYGGAQYCGDGEDSPGPSTSSMPLSGAGKGKASGTAASTSKWGWPQAPAHSPAALAVAVPSPTVVGQRGVEDGRSREAECRALFAQNLLLSTIDLGGLGLGEQDKER